MTWTFKSLDTNYNAKLAELKTKQTKKDEALAAAKTKRDDFDDDESNKNIPTTDRRDVKVRVLTKEEGRLEQAIRVEKINKTISDEREKILNKMIDNGELDPKDKYTEATTSLVAREIMKTS